MNTLKAEKRSMDIKAKKLRREGYVTGNVFGRSLAESIPVQSLPMPGITVAMPSPPSEQP